MAFKALCLAFSKKRESLFKIPVVYIIFTYIHTIYSWLYVCCSLAHLFCHHQQFLVDGKIVPTILTSWKKVGCGLYSSRPRRPQEARAVWLASAELIRPPSTASGSLKKPPKSVHVQSSIAAGLPPFLPLYESDKKKKKSDVHSIFSYTNIIKNLFRNQNKYWKKGTRPGTMTLKGHFSFERFQA